MRPAPVASRAACILLLAGRQRGDELSFYLRPSGQECRARPLLATPRRIVVTLVKDPLER